MTSVVQKSFRLKADMVALTVMQLQTTELEDIEVELNLTTSKAPRFFDKAPVVIDVREINASALKLQEFVDLLKKFNIVPMGIRGLSEEQQKQAAAIGLTCLQTPSMTSGNPHTPLQTAVPGDSVGAMVVTKAVRAGTKIYAKGKDLIIIGPVNVGAECLADGNIHVYGPLRGRALAGASGDTGARIFCHSLDAELVAIAGFYQVRESLIIPDNHAGVLQVYLNDNKLMIESI